MNDTVTTIKVRSGLRDRLRHLAQQQRTSMADVLDRAIATLERESFLAQVHADMARLRHEDPEEWESYRAESDEWERATIHDGLGEEGRDS